MAKIKKSDFLVGPYKRLNIKKVAAHLVERALEDNYMPTGWDLWQNYPISDDQQMRLVKREAKRFAQVTHGRMWSYHPQTNTYRMCPEGDALVAYEMLDYACKHAADGSKSLGVLVTAAFNQSFITQSQNTSANKKLDRISRTLRGMAEDLGLGA